MGTRARPPARLGALHVVEWGRPALAVLDELLATAQADDPLAPVTVVVPSSHAGATVRRAIATAPGRSGLVNVGFVSFPQLAETLAAPQLAAEPRPPLSPAVRLAAIRAALRDHPTWFGGAAGSPSALATLARTLGELTGLEPPALDRLATIDRRAADVVALFGDVQARCAGYADDRDATGAAVRAVVAGGRPADEVGHVVVYVPRRLRPLDLDLAAALAVADRLSVVLGTDGREPGADVTFVDQVRSRLPDLPVVDGAPTGDTIAGLDPPADVRLARAADPHEEARHAVRQVLDAAARGVPVDRMAIVARVTEPAHALVHEELAAAGVPHHGPTGLVLGQSVAGRVLLGALDLFEHDFPRPDLFQWLRAGPVRGPEGEWLRVDRLDRTAREAGIPGGYAAWCERLDAEQARLEAERGPLPPATGEPTEGEPTEGGPVGPVESDTGEPVAPARPDRFARRLDDLRSLRAVVDWLAGEAGAFADADGWAARAAWAESFLAAALGPPERLRPRAQEGNDAPDAADAPDGGADREEAAYLRILQALGSLADLDGVDPAGDEAAFRAVLGLVLDAPLPPAGQFGLGVFVGTLADAAGADHDLLLVLGMAEGVYPPRGQDDPVLPDAVRAALGVSSLPPRRPARADERRDHVAALAGSTTAALSFARADTRAQRERYPSRWYLDELRRRWGRPDEQPVGVDELDGLADRDLPWWTDVVSFVAAVEAAAGAPAPSDLPLVTPAERSAAAILAHRTLAADGTGGRVELPDDRGELHRGAAAVLERSGGTFGPFTGRVGGHPRLRFADDRVGSATALETWATCPFRYFLRQVLHVRPLDERAEADDINALDRGLYVHAVLERFVDDGLPADDESEPPFQPIVEAIADEPFGQLGRAELDRLRTMAAEVGEQFRLEGRTGRPLLWKLRSRQLLRLLEQILKVDHGHRLDRSVRPVAVELAFGSRDEAGEWTGVPPVVIDLSGERSVAFRGYVDRVDRSTDGDRLVVIDYKTGKSAGYKEVSPKGERGDIVSRGQHLQLALYAMAAESAFGDTTEVSAFFWFVEQVTDAFVGGDIDGWARQRLVDVLEIVVGGIEDGWFPARPGNEDYFWGFENCAFCDYNRVCPSARAEQWERVRLAPELAPYRDLAEGPLVAPEEVEA